MKIVTDLSLTSAPHRPRQVWNPATVFAEGAQGLWCDPSDQSTLFQDVEGTIPVQADGDPVALMLDQSGNGNHVSQTAVASRPTWRSEGSRGWLEFDGVDDFLDSAVLDLSHTDKVFVSVGLSNINQITNTVAIAYGEGQNPRGFLLFPCGNPASTMRWRAGGDLSGDISTPVSYPAVLSGLSDLSLARNVARVNGQVASGGIFSSDMNDFETGVLMIGRRSTGSHFSGELHAVLVMDGIPTSSDLDRAEGYTPSPAEAEFDGLTAGLGTIQLCP